MSNKVALAGVGILVLIAGAAFAHDRDAGWLTVVLLGLVLGLGSLAAVDANQKVRSQQRNLNRWKKAYDQRLAVVEHELLRRGAHVETATRDDVLGTVKLMQEQYVGRLDRAQAELEQAVAALRTAGVPSSAD